MARKIIANTGKVINLEKEGGRDFKLRFNERMEAYRRDYDIDSLNSSNDLALLNLLIRSELLLEDLQSKMQEMLASEEDLASQANELKKISDLIRDMAKQVSDHQKTLSIDRKSRQQDQGNNFAEYIKFLKKEAQNFVDDQLTKIYCPDCKIMVARYSPVHKHTAFVVSTECNQCGKSVRMNRDAKDVWFDIKDADWRKQYPVEIVQPVKRGFDSKLITEDIENELFIEAVEKQEFSLETEEALEPVKIQGLSHDLMIGEGYGIKE